MLELTIADLEKVSQHTQVKVKTLDKLNFFTGSHLSVLSTKDSNVKLSVSYYGNTPRYFEYDSVSRTIVDTERGTILEKDAILQLA